MIKKIYSYVAFAFGLSLEQMKLRAVIISIVIPVVLKMLELVRHATATNLRPNGMLSI